MVSIWIICPCFLLELTGDGAYVGNSYTITWCCMLLLASMADSLISLAALRLSNSERSSQAGFSHHVLKWNIKKKHGVRWGKAGYKRGNSPGRGTNPPWNHRRLSYKPESLQ